MDLLVREIDYEYDADGRRTSVTTDGVAANYQWDGFELDAITGGLDLSFVHDDAGRVSFIDRPGASNDLNLAYDAFDGLAAITDADGNPILQTKHDALGRRTVVKGDSDKDVLVAPTLGDHESPILAVAPGNFAAFTYAGDMPLMRMTSDGPVYYLSDANGSIIGIGDDNGGIGLTDYDAFGNIMNQSGLMTTVPAFLDGDFGFHAGWVDPDTGLIQFRARTYDPVSGLFLSRDAGDVSESEIESFDPYQFSYDNPFAYSDPSGNFSIASLGVGMSVSSHMRTGKNAAIAKARQILKDELQEFVIDKIVDHIVTWVGATLKGALTNAGPPWLQGMEFEKKANEGICNAFGSIPGWLHFRPTINSHGVFTSDGLKCPGTGGVFAPAGSSIPDFVLGPNDPTHAEKGTMWLTGDFKLYLTTAYNAWKPTGYNREQFKAMSRNARRYNFAPVMAVVSYKSSSPSSHLSYSKVHLKLHKIAKDRRVILLAVTLSTPRFNKKISGSVAKSVFGGIL